MSISIAMAVYNGERFIREQLESFLGQTRLPDELVVSDNASADRTVEIVREFAARAPFPVRLFINESNLGVTKNFERAIRECTGDIIFLSDCDDVWYPDKLQAMEEALARCPEAGVAVCDADVVDETLRPLGYGLWDSMHFRPSPRTLRKLAAGRSFLRSAPGQGMCIAFRARFKALVLPLPGGDHFRRMGHDSFIAWTISCSGAAGTIFVPRALAAYRQHSRQMTGAVPPESTLGRWRRFYRDRRKRAWSPVFAAVASRLEELPPVPGAVNAQVRSAILRHWHTRASLPPRRLARLRPVLRELASLRYHRFSSGLLTALKDLLFVE